VCRDSDVDFLDFFETDTFFFLMVTVQQKNLPLLGLVLASFFLYVIFSRSSSSPDVNTKETYTVFLIRHGFAAHNADVRNGWKIRDPELTQRGRKEATALAQNFAQKEEEVDFVISSPLIRTLQTAALAFPKQQIIAFPELQERLTHPCDTGSPVKEIRNKMKMPETSQLDLSALDDDWFKTKLPDAVFPVKLSERIRALCPPGSRLAIVAHDGVIRSWTGKQFKNGEMQKFVLHDLAAFK
jgi:broad specificity phosphatase PhoE